MVEDLELVQVLANIITMVERQGPVAMVVAAVEGKVEVLGDLWVMGLVVALDLALALVIQGTITMVI
jgi:predicted deacylase